MRDHLRHLERRLPRYTSYPTAPHFGAGIGAAQYRSWLGAVAPKTTVSLYLHIPFCQELCWFCGCHTRVVRNAEIVGRYAERLMDEIDLVAGALPGNLPVGQVHFGGGSPNALGAETLAHVMDRLDRRFWLGQDTEVAVELDPRTTDEAFIRACAAAGITRASVGVQDLDPKVQQAINRIQPFDMVRRTMDRLRTAGIGDINLDLMYGLPHQTTDGVLATLAQVLTLQPERVALFGYAHVPHLLPRQRRIDASYLPEQDERFAMAALGHERLADAGYEAIGFDHFALPDDAIARAQRENRLHRNFQGFTEDEARVLIGLGATAISEFPELLVQNEKNSGRYRMRATAGQVTGERGIRRDAEDRRRATVIADLLCGRTAAVEPLLAEPELKDRLAPFLDRGLAVLDNGGLRITEQGRPYGRVIAVLFDRYRAEGPRFSTAI